MNSGRKLLIASLLTLGVIVIVGVIIFYAINDVKSSLEEDFERKTILWGFKCENEKCVKYKLKEENKNELHGLSHCRVKCDQSALLWPLPRKYSTLKSIKEIDIEDIDILMENESVKNNKIWKAARTRFENIIYDKSKTQFVIDSQNKSKILIHISVESDDMKIDFETDESYKISTFIEENSKKINLKISAKTFFGARHGLETISQLIFYDEVAEIFLISLMEIEDSPSFKHRGISVDTSRNFFSIEALKRNINGMAMVKMNRFHWHISDSQSFPFLLKSHPDIAINSAYSMDKIYTNEDVREVIEFGKARGIQVFIEIDMPGHIGEGFANKNLTSCFGHTLDDYCKLSKPCGQLDPSIDEVYQVLEDIFSEIYSLYDGDIR
jgi:hexosaminidase